MDHWGRFIIEVRGIKGTLLFRLFKETVRIGTLSWMNREFRVDVDSFYNKEINWEEKVYVQILTCCQCLSKVLSNSKELKESDIVETIHLLCHPFGVSNLSSLEFKLNFTTVINWCSVSREDSELQEDSNNQDLLLYTLYDHSRVYVSRLVIYFNRKMGDQEYQKSLQEGKSEDQVR